MSDIPAELNYSNLFSSGSQQETDNLLSDPNFVSLLQKLVEKYLPLILVRMMKGFFKESLLKTLEPMMEDLMRKVVKEQLDMAQEKFNARSNRMSDDEPSTSEPRHLALKFSDRIPGPVYTGTEIKGVKGNIMSVSLVDAGGNLVNTGSEASSKVEIMALLDGIDDSEGSSECGESGACTKFSEKKLRRPVLSKNYLKLKEGVAVLDDVKFRNKAKWTKNCQVRLVASFNGNVKGTTVKEAETEAFPVTDCRGNLYKKRHPPLLSDELYRLNGITRNGTPRKLLQEAKINSVKEFLIAHNLNPQSLQERLNINAEKFKTIVDHAKECEIPRDQYIYYPRFETNVAVVFDVVGCVRGLVHNDRGFFPVDDLTEDEKVAAHKMVVSAFQHGENGLLYDNEAYTSHFPVQIPNDGNTSISPCLEGPSGSIMGPNKTIEGIDFAALSQQMSPNYLESYIDGNSFYQIDIDFRGQGNNCYDNLPFSNHNTSLQSADPWMESHNIQNISSAVCQGSSAPVHSSGKATSRWKMVVTSLRKKIISVRKRIVVSEDTPAQKKQRHC